MRDAHRTAPTLIFRGFSLAVTLAAVAWSAACGDGGTEPPRPPNRAPTASGSIAAQTVTVGESATVNVAAAFSDPDGDQLSYTASTSAGGIATASVSGSAVTITGVAAGIATITVTARDPGGLTATQGISVTIEEANRAPVLLSLQIPPLILEVGDSITLDVEPFFSDPDGDPLTFTAETSDSTVVTGYMDGSVAHARAVGPGMATVSVTASDPGGLSATLTADVTVTQPNRPPMALAPQIEPATIAVGDTLPSPDLTQVFVDPDGDPLTYSAMSSDTSVLTVSVTGSVAVAVGVSAGTATVTITATDPEGLSASISGMLTVIQPNQAPVTTMGPLPPLSGEVGVTLPALDLASFFEDPDGDSLTFSAESSDTAVVRASLDSSVLTVSLVGVGTATLTVTATDPGGFSASLVADVTVGQGNQAPVAVAPEIDPATLAVGDSLGPLDLSQVFVDPDGDSLTFTAMSNDTSVVAVSVAGSSATVTAVGVGTATVTATATDPEGLSVSISGEITVIEGNQAPVTTVGPLPPLSGEVGVTLPALDLASFFEDPDGDSLTFTAESSDTAVVRASLDSSVLTVSLVGVGTATLTVTATDPGGFSASLVADVTVGQGNQAPVAVAPEIDPATLAVGDSLGPLDLSQVFVDPDGDSLTFTAMSNDTSVVAVSVAGSSATVTAVGVGTATVTATATDPEGLSVSISGEITVIEGNQAPVTTVGPIPPLSGEVGVTLPALDLASFFEDPDGDALMFMAGSSDTAVATASLDGSMLAVSLVGAGTATVTVTATDPGGLSASLEASVTVTEPNQAPVTTMGPIPPLSGEVGAALPPIDLSSFFEDPDEDVLTFTAESDDTTVVTVAVDGSTLAVSLVAVGTATVTVTATDPGGLAASLSTQVTVVQQGNQAPMTTMGPIPPQIGAKDEVLPLEGDTLDVARYFEDPDGDELTFSVESSDEAVVTASLEGSLLMLEMVSVGTATVTVTATDPGDLSASLDAMVTVAPGSRPMVAEDEDLQALVGAVASFLRVGFTIPPTVIDLKAYFSDMDEGDELTFTAMSSDTDIAEVSVVEGSRLTGTLKKEGTVTVTVTATDPVGLSVSQSVEITVLPASG